MGYISIVCIYCNLHIHFTRCTQKLCERENNESQNIWEKNYASNLSLSARVYYLPQIIYPIFLFKGFFFFNLKVSQDFLPLYQKRVTNIHISKCACMKVKMIYKILFLNSNSLQVTNFILSSATPYKMYFSCL